ncbi:hypothetical protein Fmac_016915 [Flemingia macrophylla]|uniref:Uncharacterized protein n=1 Tax=Flemingia macrophylla TaxID=520843 RepID=A0ABD1MJH7_9FABA
MGTDESDRMVEGSSSIPESDNMVQGSEQEMELREVPGWVPDSGVGIFNIANQGLGGDGVVEGFKNGSSSVLETKALVLSENDDQVLADSDQQRLSRFLKMSESEMDKVFSNDGALELHYDEYVSEKLDCMLDSEGRVAEAATIDVDGSLGDGGEDGRDGGNSGDEGKCGDCDRGIMAIASGSGVAEASGLNVDVLGGFGGEHTGDGGKDERWDGDVAANASGCIPEEAALLSLDGPIEVVGEVGGNVEKIEEEENNADCDRDGVTIASSERRLAEAVDFSMDGSARVGEENEVCQENIATMDSESIVAEASVSSLDGLVGNSGEDDGDKVGRDGGESDEEVKDEDRDGGIVHIASDNRVAEAADGISDGSLEVCEVAAAYGQKSEEDGKCEGCDGDVVRILSDVRVVEAAELGVDASIESAELLSNVKHIAKITDHSSDTPELEVLKGQLSAFYHAKGGYRLPDYVDPQPIPGVDGAVVTGPVKSTMEAPVQGPVEEIDELGHAVGVTGYTSNHKRKKKSIAELMGEDRSVPSENKEGSVADEMVNAIEPNRGKKRKGSEDGTASKPVQKKKQLLLDLDTDEEEFVANDDGSDGAKETDEGRSEKRNEKGYLSRERKKSKYLSPPFTTSAKGYMEGHMEIKSLKISREAKVPQKMAGAADLHVLPVYKGRFFDSSNYQIQDHGEMLIDPKKVQAPVVDVVFQVRNAAISPQTRRQGTSLDQFVDFAYVFRSSLYCEGSLSEVYQQSQPGRKRKKPESEHGMLNDVNQSSPKEASKLVFIQQKLQGLSLILEASGGGKSPDMMAKLESEMKALLEDVNKMVEGALV